MGISGAGGAGRVCIADDEKMLERPCIHDVMCGWSPGPSFIMHICYFVKFFGGLNTKYPC